MNGRFRRIVVAGMIFFLLSPAGLGVATAQSTEESVTYVQTVEEMRSHLQLSVELLEAGDRSAAVDHAEHPIDEHWSIVGHQLSSVNETLASELETALEQAPNRADNASASEYATYVEEEIVPLLNAAETDVVGEEQLANETFNAAIVHGMLERSVAEYREGVSDNGSVTDEEEYLDARAFASRAEQRYAEQIRGNLSEHASEELDELFETLDEEMNATTSPEEVDRIRNSIVGELAEYTGLEAETGEAGAEVIERIESDLYEALEAYEAGNDEEAKSIIKSTYLTNFEGIEGTLIQERPELVEELEADFNEELPGLIDENASVEEVHEKIEEMEGKLHESEEILESQEDEEIDLGVDNESETTDNETDTSEEATTASAGEDASETTAQDDVETTATETPGLGAAVAVLALLLVVLARAKP